MHSPVLARFLGPATGPGDDDPGGLRGVVPACDPAQHAIFHELFDSNGMMAAAAAVLLLRLLLFAEQQQQSCRKLYFFLRREKRGLLDGFPDDFDSFRIPGLHDMLGIPPLRVEGRPALVDTEIDIFFQ